MCRQAAPCPPPRSLKRPQYAGGDSQRKGGFGITKTSALISTFLLMTLGGCQVNEVILPRDRQPARPILLFDDRTQVAIYADAAFITGSKIQGDDLEFQVIYPGGCGKHEFTLYASRSFAKSKPAQADLFLSHAARGDSCDRMTRQDLFYDLSPLKEAYRQAFNDNGPILLRIYPPGSVEPILPLLRYEF